MAKAGEPRDRPRGRLDGREERARERLEQFIEEIGYSVTQVADLAGIPQANLARYVKGDSAIPLDALQPLADVFGRSPNDFISPTPGPKPDPSTLAPVLMRARPGVVVTAEDLADYEEMLARIAARRTKKKK